MVRFAALKKKTLKRNIMEAVIIIPTRPKVTEYRSRNFAMRKVDKSAMETLKKTRFLLIYASGSSI
jgi:hypothetical protein